MGSINDHHSNLSYSFAKFVCNFSPFYDTKGNYFWVWLFISLALLLMIQRRIYPLYLILIQGQKNPESTFMILLGFFISLCMSLGFLGISNLFSEI